MKRGKKKDKDKNKYEDKDKDKELVEDALLKRALGCELLESSEEYELKDGKMVLIKKKVSTKAYPPEVNALKILLKSAEDERIHLTDEELMLEKERLLRELNQVD